MSANSKWCFVISPLGSPNSDIRKYSDKFLRFIVKYSLEPMGYKVVRSDEISDPGTITVQIIRKLIEAEIVVADLTGMNPNVMYELAIRHALRKPVILMMGKGEKLPFDISTERTIFFDISDIESVENAKEELRRQIRNIESKHFTVENPFSLTQEIILQKSHGTPIEKRVATISEDIAYIKNTLDSLSLEKILMEKSELKILTRNTIPEEKWIKILVEYPGPGKSIRSKPLEISPEENVVHVLSGIWELLEMEKDSTFKPLSYTYLWDWILIRKKSRVPLIARMIYTAPASRVFRDGEVWRVEKLDEPMLNKPERFGLRRGPPPNL